MEEQVTQTQTQPAQQPQAAAPAGPTGQPADPMEIWRSFVPSHKLIIIASVIAFIGYSLDWTRLGDFSYGTSVVSYSSLIVVGLLLAVAAVFAAHFKLVAFPIKESFVYYVAGLLAAFPTGRFLYEFIQAGKETAKSTTGDGGDIYADILKEATKDLSPSLEVGFYLTAFGVLLLLFAAYRRSKEGY